MGISRPESNNAKPTAKPQQAKGGNQREREQAAGWLNLRVKTSSGEYISVKATIALEESNLVHQGMLNKIKENPDFVFEIEGTVNIPSTVVPVF